jgi:TonB family protein
MKEVWKDWEGQVAGGGFVLRQCLGAREQSAVFLTELAGQRAAVKLVRIDPEEAESQLSRWELASKLSHPHLARILGLGRCGSNDPGLLYVVTEYAEQDLSQVLPQRPLTAAEAREMLEPVLDALQYLHGNGFVHGHVKPANLLSVDGQLKLSTDGLAPVGAPCSPALKPGACDPPELAGGVMSPAVDVWSLGVTLVEALTQRLPVWRGEERPELAAPDTLPSPLLDIARHCLQPDPRYRCAIPDLRARLRPRPVAQEQPASRVKDGLQKKRYIAMAAAFAVVLAAVVAGAKLFDSGPVTRVQPQPRQEQATPPPARSVAPPPAPAAASAPGDVAGRVLPDVPQQARNTIRGSVKVAVRVLVDPSGTVSGATLESRGPSRYFAALALDAARKWTFSPAKAGGQAVPSEWILRFRFTRTGTEVVPERAGR